MTQRTIVSTKFISILMLWCAVAVALLLPASSVAQTYDIVVYGGGLGGVAAAVQAKRAAPGRSVAIFEPSDTVGGQLVSAAVSTIDVDQQPNTGIWGELLAGINSYYTQYWWNGLPQPSVEPRVARSLLNNMLANAGIPVYYGKKLSSASFPYGPGWIYSLSFLDGTVAYGTYFIDASEYGDLVRYACRQGMNGCRVGNSSTPNVNVNAKIQSITWNAVLRDYPLGIPSGLDTLFLGPPTGYTDSSFTGVLNTGDAAPPAGSVPGGFFWEIAYRFMPDTDPQNGVIQDGNLPGQGQTRGGLNWQPLNDWPMTGNELLDYYTRQQTECAAKDRTIQSIYFIRKQLRYQPVGTATVDPSWSVANDEGFDTPYNEANYCWSFASAYNQIQFNMPSQPYVRESVRGIGPYTLTGFDVWRPAPINGVNQPAPVYFPTAVSSGGYFDDFHDIGLCPSSCTAQLSDLEPVDRQKAPDGVSNIFDPYYQTNYSGPFQIPYETLFSVHTANLILAGKNISQTRVGNSATRLHPTEMRTGQAAGMVAALALQYGSPINLNPYYVQDLLAKSGQAISQYRFSDVPATDPHWAAVQNVSAHKFMLGYGNGLFGVNDPITRGQAGIVIAERFAFPLGRQGSRHPGSPSGNGIQCQDTPGTLYYDYVGWMADHGITTNCPGTYGVNNNLTREQLAVFIVRGLNYAHTYTDFTTIPLSTSTCTSSIFDDVPQDGYCPFITAVVNAGMMPTTPGNGGLLHFGYGQTISRGDFAQVIEATTAKAMAITGNPLQLSNNIPGN